MTFAEPLWGLLALLPLAAFAAWRRRAAPPRVTFPLPIPRAARRFRPDALLVLLRVAALALLAAALARPQESFRQLQRHVSGLEIVLVLDLSRSMEIEDLGARPRIDIARETIGEFIRGRKDDRIGFVVFAGEPLTLVPPTLDYGLLLRSVKDAEIGVLKDGTGIGDGLSLAVSHLRRSEAKSRVIVLLTDGDNNIGQVDPATAGEMAAGYGIRVYTIAIGREGRVKLPIRNQGVFGNIVTTYQWFDNALNPTLLRQIAQRTDGKFYRVTEEGALAEVFREIDRLEKTDMKSNERVRHEERFAAVLLAGLILLGLELLLARGLWRPAL